MTVKELRLKANLSQRELAERCGVVRQAISNIELGYNKPSVELAMKFEKIFGVEWHLFFDNEVIKNDRGE